MEKNNQTFKHDTSNLGGSMRLGSYTSVLKEDLRFFQFIKKNKINERHRHRYEVNYNFQKEDRNEWCKFVRNVSRWKSC